MYVFYRISCSSLEDESIYEKEEGCKPWQTWSQSRELHQHPRKLWDFPEKELRWIPITSVCRTENTSYNPDWWN